MRRSRAEGECGEFGDWSQPGRVLLLSRSVGAMTYATYPWRFNRMDHAQHFGSQSKN